MSLTSTDSRPSDQKGPSPAGSPRHEPRRRRRRLGGTELAGILVAVAAGLLVVLLIGPRLIGAATPHFYAGTVLQQSAAAPSLDALEFGGGGSVDLRAYEGEVVMVYFGYTGCPDVCPTTLLDASNAIAELAQGEADRVRLIMVSVDPGRDDPATVDNYARSFHPSFMGATGTASDVLDAATRYGIFYEIGEPYDPSSSDNYFVDHTSTLMAIDTTGALRVVWSPTVTPDEISGDLRELLRQ